MSKNLQQNDITITAIFGAFWGVIEVTLGTMLQISKIPFRGTFLTLIAIFIIMVSRSFLNYKGAILSVSFTAASLKLISIVGFNITPFFAIIMEGLIAELIFLLFPYSVFSSVAAGSLILFYTLIHGLIMQGIFFGPGIYGVYITIINGIGGEISYNGELSYLVIPVIVVFYLCTGGLMGWFGWKSGERAHEILSEEIL